MAPPAPPPPPSSVAAAGFTDTIMEEQEGDGGKLNRITAELTPLTRSRLTSV